MKYDALPHAVKVKCQKVYSQYLRAAYAITNNHTTTLECITVLKEIEKKVSEALDIQSPKVFEDFRSQVLQFFEASKKNIDHNWMECPLTNKYVYSYVTGVKKLRRYRSIDDP